MFACANGLHRPLTQAVLTTEYMVNGQGDALPEFD
jgi:hypothetical protein